MSSTSIKNTVELGSPVLARIFLLSVELKGQPTDSLCEDSKLCQDIFKKFLPKASLSIIAGNDFVVEVASSGFETLVKTARCLDEIRRKVYSLRADGQDVVLKASISLGSSSESPEELIATTAPMQVTLEPEVASAITAEFAIVERLPIDLPEGRKCLFYLHTPLQ